MAQEKHNKINEEVKRGDYYVRLFRKFVILAIISSIVPLLIIGWAINSHYSRFAKKRTNASFQTQLE